MRNDLEHQNQKALVRWCDYMGKPYNKIFAIPNGGQRHARVAQKLKAEGVRAGVPDLFLPVAARGFHGLFIELKIEGNSPTTKQAERLAQLNEDGYLAVCCYGWESAKAQIENYLTGEA